MACSRSSSSVLALSNTLTYSTPHLKKHFPLLSFTTTTSTTTTTTLRCNLRNPNIIKKLSPLLFRMELFSTERNKELVAYLQEYGMIRSKKVAEVMVTVDRRLFVPHGNPPYVDSPMEIGYNATISAPHMHASCLELLQENLQPGMHALDIGSGDMPNCIDLAHNKPPREGTTINAPSRDILQKSNGSRVFKSIVRSIPPHKVIDRELNILHDCKLRWEEIDLHEVPKFETLGGQIVNTRPFPSLMNAFATIDDDDRRRSIRQATLPSATVQGIIDQSALVVDSSYLRGQGQDGRGRGRGGRGRSSITCSHCGQFGHEKSRCYQLVTCSYCGQSGHEKSRCYQLIGYPVGFFERSQSSSSGRGHGKSPIAAIVDLPSSSLSSPSVAPSTIPSLDVYSHISGQIQHPQGQLEAMLGSGYLTACFGLMVGPQGCAVGVEHIPELVASSIQNIQNTAAAAPLLKEGSLCLHVGDGRLGWPEFAPYDAIHVGAAAPEIPQPLIDQLKPGGRLVIPVGNIFQDLKVIDKNLDGTITVRDETSVRYVPLTSREAQLQNY
ncbi:hypothetical protein IFM89_027715 [Coptis chinensis]|uniref:CCHC-type domain-containing protein n=1 Tax=Coptis chinensis TaxID=261450 RepID=A0A835M0X6_9MAGN|nr:hypothetical protein IFM89_027715 [Coptis chinensis]